jgi:hypothetical protein
VGFLPAFLRGFLACPFTWYHRWVAGPQERSMVDTAGLLSQTSYGLAPVLREATPPSRKSGRETG